MSDWTQKQIDTLIKLWTAGVSAAEIGEKIGMTRNAVIGKAHRLSLPEHALRPRLSNFDWKVVLRAAQRRGLCCSQLAREIGVTAAAVRKQQRHHEIFLRKDKAGRRPYRAAA